MAFQKIDDDRSSDALSPHVSSLVSAPRPATVDRLPQPGKCGAAETREGLLFVVARLVEPRRPCSRSRTFDCDRLVPALR